MKMIYIYCTLKYIPINNIHYIINDELSEYELLSSVPKYGILLLLLQLSLLEADNLTAICEPIV
jgi:hypothetical protein